MIYQRAVRVQINLDAVKNNIYAVRRILRPGTKICAVVKANAYGHGAVPAACAALEAGADMLAVAILDEAIELREGGITAPILVLGFTPVTAAPLAVAMDITLTIYSQKMALDFSEAALAAGGKIKVHLKIDTGMGRIGLAPEEAPEIIALAAKLPGLVAEGVFSHFADADNLNQAYTEFQLASFQKVLKELNTRGIRIPIKHIANSAAALQIPAAHLDMVRLGIAMYGLWPSAEMKHVLGKKLNLVPAMTLCAQVCHLKELPPGRSISYGRTYFTETVQKIATLPLGYADGLSRNLSGRMSVFFHGQKAPLAGRICMDQCMVDVTAIDGIQEGDTAVIFGAGGLSADEVAEISGTINYEVVTSISKRIPRVY